MAQKLTTYFEDFLKEIRLTDNQISELKQAHTTLQDRLMKDDGVSKYIETTFLQGSYKRSTAVRSRNGNRSDVDVVVVTKFDKDEYTPEQVLNVFEPFLERYYSGKYRKQGRSWGIQMSNVDLDLVPTSSTLLAESGVLKNEMIISNKDIYSLNEEFVNSINGYHWEAQFNDFFLDSSSDDWKIEPLYIPDRENMIWDKTHPLEQIRWTQQKNKECNGHYINVVKCIKWWRREKFPDVKHPKSYPLEHFIGDCCPDGIESVAEGIARTFESIVLDHPTKPFLSDRGVPEHDVFGRLSDEDYKAFYESVRKAETIARKAYHADSTAEAVLLWKELFGDKFPDPSESQNAIFTERNSDSRNIPGGRFA